jgi:hypothetical protein
MPPSCASTGRAEGARLLDRRHAALLRGRSVRGRQAGGRRMLAQPDRRRRDLPLAITDNLNFGNPEKPEIMGQFVGCIRASAKPAARSTSRSSPATSRSTTRPGPAILPTPTIGGVGLLADFQDSASIAFKSSGEAILVLGDTRGLARPVGLPRDHPRQRRRRAAAGRSNRGGSEGSRYRCPASGPYRGRAIDLAQRTPNICG